MNPNSPLDAQVPDEDEPTLGERGVARPMARQGVANTRKDHSEHGAPYSKPRMQMLREHTRATLWIPWTLIALGAWTMAAPFSLGYADHVVAPPGGRELWLHDSARVAAMVWSDLLSGLALMVLGWLAQKPGRPTVRWAAAAVGAWLAFAPVLFWAPNAAAYLNGTTVGPLVIALTVLVPGMPNMLAYMKMGGDLPPGWSYNPSSWPQRWILIVTGFVGWMVSRHLAMYQMGYIEDIWDPFFGAQSQQVLDSALSQAWPVSDGALGAFAYTLEFLMGWMGSPARWRTMPWMVTLFGILVIPLGLVHIFLVISQPLTVGAWCTLCLLAALIMLPMIPLEVDEVIAMTQHVLRSRRRGERTWSVFWKGGDPSAAGMDERTPPIHQFPDEPARLVRASLWGMSFPWTLLTTLVVGLATMALPAIFELEGRAADPLHLGGALIIVVAGISLGEPLRAARWLNVPLGLAVAASPAAFGAPLPAAVGAAALGLAAAALSAPRGPIRERFGSWDRYVT